MSRAYYNEIDPHAAAWLRELIAAGLIAAGDVDERSIAEVTPDDLRGYTQCHFFAGIGGWSLAARLAGWPDDRELWSGSCPCQPFSVAGKGKGVADERHLWPEFKRLIAQRKPPVVIGEQVASKDGRVWLAGVRADLESVGYAVGAADLCAAGIGAPHIRQRLYWVADAASERWDRSQDTTGQAGRSCLENSGGDGWMGNAISPRLEGYARNECHRHEPGRLGAHTAGPVAETGGDSGLSITEGQRSQMRHDAHGELHRIGSNENSSGAWDDYLWIPCADGKARRIKPGLEPLAHGLPRGVVPGGDPGAPGYAEQTGEARIMRLRGYGNAIVPQLAAEFLMAYMESST